MKKLIQYIYFEVIYNVGAIGTIGVNEAIEYGDWAMGTIGDIGVNVCLDSVDRVDAGIDDAGATGVNVANAGCVDNCEVGSTGVEVGI